MTDPTGDAWEDRCTDCDGTGITIQTERRCACQPPLDDHTRTPPVSMDEVEKLTAALLHIRRLALSDIGATFDLILGATDAALAAMPAPKEPSQ